MSDSRIPLKNRWLAAVLAFLLPGAGHLYQRRYFKSLLYFACIIPTFCFGMALGEWKITYWQRDPANVLNPYYAQFWVGLPALPALYQSRRYRDERNVENPTLDAPLDAEFHGRLQGYRDPDGRLLEGEVTGRLTLEPYDRVLGDMRGRFEGTLLAEGGGGTPLKLELGGRPDVARRIDADDERSIRCKIEYGGAERGFQSNGVIAGAIPRRFWDRFQVPLDDLQVQELHRRLGKMHELAQIFTMIAGLLNVLAIWDALEGPAYGYGDLQARRERKETPEKKSTEPDNAAGRSDAARGTSVSQPAAAKSSLA